MSGDTQSRSIRLFNKSWSVPGPDWDRSPLILRDVKLKPCHNTRHTHTHPRMGLGHATRRRRGRGRIPFFVASSQIQTRHHSTALQRLPCFAREEEKRKRICAVVNVERQADRAETETATEDLWTRDYWTEIRYKLHFCSAILFCSGHSQLL